MTWGAGKEKRFPKLAMVYRTKKVKNTSFFSRKKLQAKY